LMQTAHQKISTTSVQNWLDWPGIDKSYYILFLIIVVSDFLSNWCHHL
jgi:hypothetical protein